VRVPATDVKKVEQYCIYLIHKNEIYGKKLKYYHNAVNDKIVKHTNSKFNFLKVIAVQEKINEPVKHFCKIAKKWSQIALTNGIIPHFCM
jgi:hypothetical protein